MAHIEQVYLMVTDLDLSRWFYEEALGLDCIQAGDRSVEFDTGECRLKLEETFDKETLAAFGLDPPGEDRGAGAIVVLRVPDVGAVYDRAVAAGVEPLMEPRSVDWGRRLTLVEDPDGYIIELSTPENNVDIERDKSP